MSYVSREAFRLDDGRCVRSLILRPGREVRCVPRAGRMGPHDNKSHIAPGGQIAVHMSSYIIITIVWTRISQTFLYQRSKSNWTCLKSLQSAEDSCNNRWILIVLNGLSNEKPMIYPKPPPPRYRTTPSVWRRSGLRSCERSCALQLRTVGIRNLPGLTWQVRSDSYSICTYCVHTFIPSSYWTGSYEELRCIGVVCL